MDQSEKINQKKRSTRNKIMIAIPLVFLIVGILSALTRASTPAKESIQQKETKKTFKTFNSGKAL